MQTRVVIIDPSIPAQAVLEDAAAVLGAGGLVAFPTETVYGLGANALDAAAVARIFAAKGRPPTNPLIVHIADRAAALPLVREFSETARRLAERFWPGPLSLVLPKSERVPDLVTAGGPTVALRVPAHPVALGLLRVCGFPLAAPSANPSTMLSPTTAAHVLRGLADKIDLVLDAGPTASGLESTVLDVSVTPPRLWRPGLVTAEAIEEIIGPIETGPMPRQETARPARSPGQTPRHYAPRTPLECVAGGERRVVELAAARMRVGWLRFSPTSSPPPNVLVEELPDDPQGYAAGLYAALHRLDAAGLDRIVADLPPDTPPWRAVHDRLRRAAAS